MIKWDPNGPFCTRNHGIHGENSWHERVGKTCSVLSPPHMHWYTFCHGHTYIWHMEPQDERSINPGISNLYRYFFLFTHLQMDSYYFWPRKLVVNSIWTIDSLKSLHLALKLYFCPVLTLLYNFQICPFNNSVYEETIKFRVLNLRHFSNEGKKNRDISK